MTPYFRITVMVLLVFFCFLSLVQCSIADSFKNGENLMDVKYIVVHCSDSPHGRGDTAETIHRWHKERGFDGVGYHYIIDENGVKSAGRPEYWQGAHVSGHNHHSLGVCLIGRDEFTDSQRVELAHLLGQLQGKYSGSEVVGHYELDHSKTCPNMNVKEWLSEL